MAHAHAKLSPSSAHRWTRCAGSVALEATVPQQDTEYSIDGTLTHALAEHCLTNAVWNPRTLVGQTMQLDARYPDVTIEMDRAERVAVYLDHIATLLLHPDYVMHAVESRLDLAGALGRPSFGTADFIAVVGTTLHVVDYKDGRGEIVHPDGNEQLILYGAGAMHALPAGMRISHVCLTIVQPKTQHRPESHTYTLGEFSAEVGEIAAAARNVSDAAPRVAGDKQCRFCRAKGICPEAQERAYKAAAKLFEGEVITSDAPQAVDVRTLPDDRLAELLDAEAFIRQVLDAVAEEAVRRITTGGSVRGYKMVAGKNKRDWSAEATPEALAKVLHCSTDFFYDKKLKTPAAVEKELPAAGKKLLEPFVVKTAGAPTLAKESDKRPALQYDAQVLFAAHDNTAAPAAVLSFA